jgi:hypothetical protein
MYHKHSDTHLGTFFTRVKTGEICWNRLAGSNVRIRVYPGWIVDVCNCWMSHALNGLSMDWFKGKSTGNHRFSH